MKLRIIEQPDGYVELQQRKWFKWVYVQSWYCADIHDAWAKARKYANTMLNPAVEYP